MMQQLLGLFRELPRKVIAYSGKPALPAPAGELLLRAAFDRLPYRKSRLE